MTTEDNKSNFIDFMVTSTGSTTQTIIKSEFETNNNNVGDSLRLPTEFSIEYWNSPSSLSIEKEDSNIWETSLLDESLKYFNTQLEQHADTSTTSETCDNPDGNIIYTTLTSLSNDPSSPSISLEEPSPSNSVGTTKPTLTWYHPPTSSTSTLDSPSSNAQQDQIIIKVEDTNDKLVPQIDLDTFLNIIPQQTNTQTYQTNDTETFTNNSTDKFSTISTENFNESTKDTEIFVNTTTSSSTTTLETYPSSTEFNYTEWKDTTDSSTVWKSTENDSLLRNALEGKSIFKYNNNTSNDFILIKEEDNNSSNNIILDNSNTIIYPVDSNSSQSIDEILQNINTNYETSSIDEFNNNEYKQINGNGEIEIYYAIDNSINVNYTTQSPSSTIIGTTTNTAKKKKTKSKANNCSSTTVSSNNGSTSSEFLKKERSLHYCEICCKGFKDKYSVNVHVRTHTGEKPFPCKICCKTFRQKAHLAKHFQTHLASTQQSTNINSNNKCKIMKT